MTAMLYGATPTMGRCLFLNDPGSFCGFRRGFPDKRVCMPQGLTTSSAIVLFPGSTGAFEKLGNGLRQVFLSAHKLDPRKQ